MWTKEKPKKEGYYWVHTKGILSGKDRVHPVHVYSQKGGEIDTVFSDGENFSIESDMFIQWYSEEIAMPVHVIKKMPCPWCKQMVEASNNGILFFHNDGKEECPGSGGEAKKLF